MIAKERLSRAPAYSCRFVIKTLDNDEALSPKKQQRPHEILSDIKEYITLPNVI
jgi:hypothetical protein